MAMTPLDKMRLMGVIKKNRVGTYDDLYIDTRSKLNIYDYLNATIDLTLKFINENQNESVILNAISAIEVTLMQMYTFGKDIKEENYQRILKVKELASNYNNEEIKEKLTNLVKIYQSSIRNFNDTITSEIEVDQVIEKLALEPNEKQETYDGNVEKDATEMQELKVLIETLQNHVIALEKDIERKDKIAKENKEDLEKKNQELFQMRNKVKELTKELKKLNNRYNKLETQYQKAKEDAEASSLKIASLESENHELGIENQELKRYYSEQQYASFAAKRNEDIVNAVLKVIANKHSTLFEISQELRENGLKATLNEINSAIKELRTKYEIDDSFLVNFDKSYFIKAKKPVSNKIFKMNITRKSYQFIVISDLHMLKLNNYITDVFQRVYDYMYNNSIDTIVNLGDFLDHGYLSGATRDNCMRYNDQIINSIISSFPYEKGIKHLIMGGNHEELILRYGIDPFEILESNRQDFFSLGHNSAFLQFNDNYIGLFHPKFRLKSKRDITSATHKLEQFVNSKCASANININDLFMSLFGHFHIGNVYPDNIITSPSLTDDRQCNGAWRIKVYFDSFGNIENGKLTRIILGKELKDAKTYELGKKLTK